MDASCRDHSLHTAIPFAPLARRELESAWIAFFVSLCAFAALSTTGLADDGPQLLQEFTRPDGLVLWNHVLYFPAARALVLLGFDAAQSLSLLSAISCAVVVGCANAMARIVTGSARAAMATTIAVALTPCVTFHATFLEVHALHAATVAATLLAIVASAHDSSRTWKSAFVGAAFCSLTHRSAPLLGPALTSVAVVVMRHAGHRMPKTAAVLAVASGMLVGLGIDEALHVWLGGPRLMDSVEQVGIAVRSGLDVMLLDETILQLGALLVVLLPFGGSALLTAPRLAMLCYGPAIVHAGIVTHGGYWLGAVPFLAIGFALCAQRATARHWLLQCALALSVGLSGGIALRDVAFDAERESLQNLRNRRAEAATAWLPNGGELLSTGLAMQHVDGLAPGVRDHDLGTQIGKRLLAGDSIESIEQAVVDAVRMVCTNGASEVVWTCEWRSIDLLPRAVHDAMERIEGRVIAEFRGEQRLSEHGESWRLDVRGAQ